MFYHRDFDVIEDTILTIEIADDPSGYLTESIASVINHCYKDIGEKRCITEGHLDNGNSTITMQMKWYDKTDGSKSVLLDRHLIEYETKCLTKLAGANVAFLFTGASEMYIYIDW